MLSETSKWQAAGAVLGVYIILMNHLVLSLMDFLFLNKGWIYCDKRLQWFGFLFMGVILFFTVFGILNIDWECA
jgi:heme/copper-type cytochrome/quinol oxidase subunit 4